MNIDINYSPHHLFMTLLLLLLFGHALADYALQSEFMAKAKNRHTPIGHEYWPYVLAAHSMIHAGIVLIVTGSTGLCFIELITHFLLDYKRCEGHITLKTDQFCHVGLKVFYAAVAYFAISHQSLLISLHQ